MNNMYKNEYIPPTLTVDAILFQIIDKKLNVLLIQRTGEPFKDQWALPGIYNAVGETTHHALSRALLRKAGVDLSQIHRVEQLYTFDTVARDPRGHAVSVSYMCLGYDIMPKTDAGVQHPTWFPVDDLPELAFDHVSIIRYARRRLASKMTYTNIVAALLPNEFTLSELQVVHEAIFDHSLDKRNFRKKFLSLDFIKETGAIRQNGAHRPAKLYRFNTRKLQEIVSNY